MPFLNIDGWEIDCKINAVSENNIEIGGEKIRAFDGTLLSTKQADKREWSFEIPFTAQAKAEALKGLIQGRGHIWKYDSSLFSTGKGLPQSLTRATTAYKSDGTSAAAGAARYENGKFYSTNTSDKALLIEEGTTNVLTANQASVETDTTGFTAVGSTIAQDASQYWNGTKSLSCHSDNAAAQEGFYTGNATVTANKSYTASVWLKGDVGATVQLVINERTAADADVGSTISSPITLSATWTRYSVTRVFGATGERARIYVETDVQQHITWYVDGLQIEQKDYATYWQLPGSARNAEIITNSSSVINQAGQKWSVHFLFNPTSTQIVTGKTGYLWECYIDASNWYRILVAATGKVYAEARSGGVTYTSSSASMPAMVPGTWYYIALTADGTHLNLYSNGAVIATDTDYIEPSGTLPTSMYLGSDHNGANHANGMFDQFMIVPYCMQAAQIAALYALTIAPSSLPRLNISGTLVDRVIAKPIVCQGQLNDTTWHYLGAANKEVIKFSLLEC